jgi:hypothetical protein
VREPTDRDFYSVRLDPDDAVEVFVFGKIHQAVILNRWSTMNDITTYFVLYTYDGVDYVQGIRTPDNIRRIRKEGELEEVGIACY